MVGAAMADTDTGSVLTVVTVACVAEFDGITLELLVIVVMTAPKPPYALPETRKSHTN